MLHITIFSLLWTLRGMYLSLRAIAAALLSLSVRVLPFLLWVKFMCEPRSLKLLTLGMVRLLSSHMCSQSFLRVIGEVAKVKHLLSATFAPMSWKKSLLERIARMVRAKCPSPLVVNIRSSASTLGVTFWFVIKSVQGTKRRAIIVIEKGHPCGMEHLSSCLAPMVLPILSMYRKYGSRILRGMPASVANPSMSLRLIWSKHL